MRESYFHLYDLWKPNDVYTHHRIPGMLVTARGTLLVYCEARRSLSDWALMDILLQRSVDHGETFSAPVVLAAGCEAHSTVNNPVMMQEANGRIHFLYCEDYSVDGGRLLRRYSDDDGLTWSEPIDITRFASPEFHNAFAFGPGHGIVTRDGTLLVPVWMVPKYHEAPLRSHTPSVLSTFYSKDGGETWALGEILDNSSRVICPNESVAALTSDGGVYMNIRFQGFCRARAYSRDGYTSWADYDADYALVDPQCFGSVAAFDDGKHPYTLIFANCANKRSRTNVTVKASTDDGRTFPVSRVLDVERGGYVEVAVDNDAGLIYVLYEDKMGVTDHLAVFDYEWLMQEHDA